MVYPEIRWGSHGDFYEFGGLSTVTFVDSKIRGEMMGMYNGLYRIGSLVGTLLGGMTAPMIGLRGIALCNSTTASTLFPTASTVGTH